LVVEIQVTKTLRFAGLSVEHNFCAGKFVALALEILVQVEIKGLVTEVANVESNEIAIFSFLIRLVSSSLHLESKVHWANT